MMSRARTVQIQARPQSVPALLFAVLAVLSLAEQGQAQSSRFAEPSAQLLRIQMVTVGTDDVEGFRTAYQRWFGYQSAGTGTVSQALARSWGAPASAGRKYALLHSPGTPDVWLRIVDVDIPDPQPAMTTYGWSVIEFLVTDPDAVYERLLASPFRHIGGPAYLGDGSSSIRATQFIGPAAVAIYLTADTAPAESAGLPRARSLFDRPFIVVLATPNPDSTHAFYRDTFSLGGYAPRPTTVGVVNKALGLADDHAITLGLATGAEAVNAIEIDGYPPGLAPRAHAAGQLPPGIALVSFAVVTLDGLNLDFLEAPEALYGERRAATFVGPAGELTELIEVGPGGDG